MASEKALVKLEITRSFCEYAGGTFTAPFWDASLAAFGAKGFKISPGRGDWYIGGSSTLGNGIDGSYSLQLSCQ